MDLIIATPFYEGRGFAPFISSLTATVRELTKLGIEWDFWSLSGHAYVDDARNEIATRFLQDSDARRLIFIDSDMSWDVPGFLRLMTADAPIVGGAYPVKNAWDRWTCVWERDDEGHCVGRERADGGGWLLAAEVVSGGFLKIERGALQMLAPHVKRYQTHLIGSDGPTEQEWIGFFTREHPHGEDISFCKRWQALGGKLWIEPQISFGHTGQRTWSGNLHETLAGRAKADAALVSGSVEEFFGVDLQSLVG